jgi:cell wall-associated NlpC family hydrolase
MRRRNLAGGTIAAVLAAAVLAGSPVAAEPDDTRAPAETLPDDTGTPRIAQPDDIDTPGARDDGNTPRADQADTPAVGLPPVVGELLNLRLQAQEAITEAEIAKVRAEQARRRADAARLSATLARLRARHHQDELDRFAAQLYRGEVGIADVVDVAEAGMLAPERVGDAAQWTAIIGRDRDRVVAETRLALTRAERLERAADGALQRAESDEHEARRRRENADTILASTETALRALVGSDFRHQLTVGPDGCPTGAPPGTLRGTADAEDVAHLCARSVALAPTPEAALAIKYAFRVLGAAYACDGIGRNLPMRYDCSSLVTRAYAEGAGLNTASDIWIPTTRDLLPWDGARQAPWSQTIDAEEALPGDLVLYDTEHLASRHVVMVLADGYMLHVAECGDVANVTNFWGHRNGDGYTYLGTRRIDPTAARAPSTEIPSGDVPWLDDAVGQEPDALDPSVDPPSGPDADTETATEDQEVADVDTIDASGTNAEDVAERNLRTRPTQQTDTETQRRIRRHEERRASASTPLR